MTVDASAPAQLASKSARLSATSCARQAARTPEWESPAPFVSAVLTLGVGMWKDDRSAAPSAGAKYAPLSSLRTRM